MVKKTPKFCIIFGRTDFFAEEGLRTLFVSSDEEVRKLALEFIYVIPDDLNSYQDDIRDWDGQSHLIITHQDDDTFLFSVSLIEATTDLTDFNNFVNEFRHEEY